MNQPVRSRRSGGRTARHALRSAPLAENVKPVRMGLEGSTYKPLSNDDIAQIHTAVLDVLENIGLSQATPGCIKACTGVGATFGEDGRLRFPPQLIEDTIANANRDFTLHGRDPKHDLHPQGQKVHFGTAGAAVHVVDVEKNEYRESNLQDIYDAARMVDVQDNIHFFQRPMVARDMKSARDLDINTLYACLSGTTKHIGCSISFPEDIDEVVELLYTVAGSEAEFRARPFVSMSNCFVVPPLRLAEDACKILEGTVRAGIPILLLSAGQAGATSPAAVAGSIVQATAEVLAGLVYVNAIVPGHPAIYGAWPFVSDLRTGAMSGGSGEQSLLTAACGQMAAHYDLPCGAPAGMSDSKMPDIQAGYEKGVTTVMAGLSGANLIYESAGMHGSLMGFCLESLIIDNDMLGQVLRCVRGIEINENTLSIETMRNVCTEGPNHYLGHEQTLSLMESEYIYPVIGSRLSPKEWAEEEKPVIVDLAIKEKRRILDEYFPAHIAPELDAELRDKFDIYLPRKNMKK